MAIWKRLFPKIDERAFKWIGPMPTKGSSFIGGYSQGYRSKTEAPIDTVQAYIDELYKSSSVVYSAAKARANLFSEIRFQWKPIKEPATQFNLFGSPELSLLERPWPGGTTKDLCKRAIQDVDTSGCFFARKERNLRGVERLRRLKPDWVTIELTGDPSVDVEVDIDHFAYWPGGIHSGNTPERIKPEDMVFWAPEPDPNAMFRGMTWLTPAIEAILVSKSSTKHMHNFFKKGAQLGIVAMIKPEVDATREEIQQSREEFLAAHAGAENSYEPLFLGHAYDLQVFQNPLKDLDMSSVRAHVEAHITGPAGVPAVMLGLAEGQSTSALGISNLKPAVEGFIDRTMRDLWHSFCDALEPVIGPPTNKVGQVIQGQRLWYSDADISVLNRDRKEDAEIIASNMQAILAATMNGAKFKSAKEAVQSGDIKKLEHTGDQSVQLQQKSEISKAKLEAINLALKAGATQESAVEAIEADDLSKLVFEDPPKKEDAPPNSGEDEEENPTGDEDSEEETETPQNEEGE